MDSGYRNTISGLLHKRGEMLANMADLREQIAVASNDLESLERVLETLGYEGELPNRLNTRTAYRAVLQGRAAGLPTPALEGTRPGHVAGTGAAWCVCYIRPRMAVGWVRSSSPHGRGPPGFSSSPKAKAAEQILGSRSQAGFGITQ
jgi:hypothetical protein